MNVKRLLVLLIAGTVAACGVAPTPQPTPIQSSTPTATLRPSSPTTAVPAATASPVPSGSPATLAVSTFKFPDSLDVVPGSRTLTGVDLVSVPAVGPGTAGRYPTQKPDELGRVLARIANIGRGDVVLDPFVGSGALLVGARERGAHVIGCDIAPAALRTAKAKLGAAGAIARPGRSSSPRAGTGRRRPVPKGPPRRGS
jgi:DNA methylase